MTALFFAVIGMIYHQAGTRDDGFSGANFQRPGFQAMLADIEAGKVGTVIVQQFLQEC